MLEACQVGRHDDSRDSRHRNLSARFPCLVFDSDTDSDQKPAGRSALSLAIEDFKKRRASFELSVEGHEESHDYFPETNPQADAGVAEQTRARPTRVSSFWQRNEVLRESNKMQLQLLREGLKQEIKLQPVQPDGPPTACAFCGLYAFGVCPHCEDIICTICAGGWVCKYCEQSGPHPSTHASTSSSSRHRE